MNALNTIPLNTVAIFLGGLLALLGLPALLAPEPTTRGLRAFARNAKASWVLTAVDLAWVAWIVLHASLGSFENLKPAIYLIAPAFFYLLVTYLDEMLASRSLGGLLLLVANPILYSARWHPSPWRLVMSTLAYVMVVAGMVLVLSPFRFRDWAAGATKSAARCRLLGCASFAIGVIVIALGFLVY